MASEDDVIEDFEIDFALDDVVQILTDAGITNYTSELLVALWDWREKARHGA